MNEYEEWDTAKNKHHRQERIARLLSAHQVPYTRYLVHNIILLRCRIRCTWKPLSPPIVYIKKSASGRRRKRVLVCLCACELMASPSLLRRNHPRVRRFQGRRDFILIIIILYYVVRVRGHT